MAPDFALFLFFCGFPGFLGGVSSFLGVFRFFLGVFLVFLGCFWFSWGVPGFLGGVPGFRGVFLVFLGCSWFSWECSGFLGGVPECSVMFRCSGVPCSGVPVFLQVLHAGYAALHGNDKEINRYNNSKRKINLHCHGTVARRERHSV